MNRLITLEWIPLQQHMLLISQGCPEYEDLKLLFHTYGWPDNLDGPGFDAAAERWNEFNKVCDMARGPRRKVDELKKVHADLEKSYHQHADRVRNGVWDHYVNKPTERVAELERQLEQLKEAVAKDDVKIKAAMKELEGLGSGDVEMERAWKKVLERDLQSILEHYNWLLGEGKQYAKTDEMRKMKEDMEALEERLRNIKMQPKTAVQAIKPQ